jgi:ppGpp synthetase/RelA/SpoT-type nucleotidyltranferase
MTPQPVLTHDLHKQQIVAFTAVRPQYELYAKLLARVLSAACKPSFPEAFVQSRAKAVASFAEKAARKFARYPDAVHQMTDLCGARVIVQTTEQVAAVRMFIEANFQIDERDDKGLLLGEQEFGYRDMHYIVKLMGARCPVLGITADEFAKLEGLPAEIQVRTWVQHAWADTLHDRIYKNKLRISSSVKRTGNLLAAMMEEADRNFTQLADDLDGLIANYSAVAPKKELDEEIAVQELILRNAETGKQRGLALKLAALVAVTGDYERTAELLEPHANVDDASQAELLLELGTALCRRDRKQPASAGYGAGLSHLKRAEEAAESDDVMFAPHLRRRASIRARIQARLGEALARISDRVADARSAYQRAHELEPQNPYYLAEMIGLEMSCGNRAGLPAAMRTTLREAIKTCVSHAVANIELPRAYVTAGRLSLFLGQSLAAIGCYARAIRHVLAGVHVVPETMLADEVSWLARVHYGLKIPAEYQNVIDLLNLAERLRKSGGNESGTAASPGTVLVVAGGAASASEDTLATARRLLIRALPRFAGTVVSGGTCSGVPGCVGDVARELGARGGKAFKLVGYVPTRLPHGVQTHAAYEPLVTVGDDFGADQLIRYWHDVFDHGVSPDAVTVLGFGGGPLAAAEYRIALGFGAIVGVVEGTKGTAAELLADPLWIGTTGLMELPADEATARAFVVPRASPFDAEIQTEMAKAFHDRYVASSSGRLPANMRPWSKLADTFRQANLEQAAYVVEILESSGFVVRSAAGSAPSAFAGFTDTEVECMAEMEHGRWNVERLRGGWRGGKVRDDGRRIHDCIVRWADLPDVIKSYDREAVRLFPTVLAQAGLEVVRG